MTEFWDHLRRLAREKFGKMKLRVRGIDLGTTNSTVAEIVWDLAQNGLPEVRCIPLEQETEEGSATSIFLPSVVWHDGVRALVGEGAKRKRARAVDAGAERGRDLFWECKNDMGLQRTYHRAGEGFRNATEIGGHVLQCVLDGCEGEYERTVVTVPASFQAAQRRDTQRAGGLAGLELVAGDLVDEPLAAFLHFALSQNLGALLNLKQPRHLLVFDFGGGTCDIGLFRMEPAKGLPRISPLAVSRYCRLGGGDIDAAIVHECLIPQIIAQNDLAPHELDYKEKKEAIEPALLSVAEGLKIKLCQTITQSQAFGRYAALDKSELREINPGYHPCPLRNDRKLGLRSPSLSAADFETLMKPFLDTEILVAKETEYRMSCSIFAPLSDALDRADLDSKNVDYVLMLGGSSLIPQVVNAVSDYFQNAQMLKWAEPTETQTAVACGGAWHALMLAVTGEGLCQTIIGDALLIRTEGKSVELIPRGSSLPFPGPKFAECRSLAVPLGSRTEEVELRMELVNGENQLLITMLVPIPPPVQKGEPLVLRYRMDQNQLLEIEIALVSRPDKPIRFGLESPHTHILNAYEAREKIDQLEEDLKTNKIARANWPASLMRLAELHEELNQMERALELWKSAMKALGRRSAFILNRMASLRDRLRDYETADRLYLESATETAEGWPAFNHALSYQRRGMLSEARERVEAAISCEADAAYFVLLAQIANKQNDVVRRESALKKSLELFGEMETLNDWELLWFKSGAELRGDSKAVTAASAEQKRRKVTAPPTLSGSLPALVSGDE